MAEIATTPALSSNDVCAVVSASARRAASVRRSMGLRATAASTRCETWPTPTTTGLRGSVTRRLLGLRRGEHGPGRFAARCTVATYRAVRAMRAQRRVGDALPFVAAHP